jgi:hypothetical protein
MREEKKKLGGIVRKKVREVVTSPAAGALFSRPRGSIVERCYNLPTFGATGLLRWLNRVLQKEELSTQNSLETECSQL